MIPCIAAIEAAIQRMLAERDRHVQKQRYAPQPETPTAFADIDDESPAPMETA